MDIKGMSIFATILFTSRLLMHHPEEHGPVSAACYLPVVCTVGLCAVLAACGDDAHNDGRHIDGLPRLTVVSTARIGSVDDPDVGFSQLAMVDVDQDGNVYALEAMDNQIRVYASDGHVVRRIGRHGSGPGEFQEPPLFGLHGDTLWTYDRAAGRITLFDRGGNVLFTSATRGLRIPLHDRYGFILPWRMRSDGRFTGWMISVGISRDDPPPPSDSDEHARVPRVVFDFDASGEVVDTVGWTPSPPPNLVLPQGYRAGQFERMTVGTRRYLVPDPPSAAPIWLPLDDGHIVVDVPYAVDEETSTFVVTRVGLASDTIYQRILDYDPVRFTAEDLDSVAARGSRGYGNSEAPDAERKAAQNVIRAALRFPEFKRPISRAWLAQDEAVWLLRNDTPSAVARWIVLDPHGRPRGELQLPTNTRPLWSRGDRLWVSELDEHDVPWLVQYRIDRGP
jgi:hypothetical protein